MEIPFIPCINKSITLCHSLLFRCGHFVLTSTVRHPRQKMALAGKVAVVTGASRGIGKGIALQLGAAGATVYITGRTKSNSQNAKNPGSLEETAREVEARGGTCIPVACDHSKDADIDALFEQVNREQNGQLDILVNNAFSAVTSLIDSQNKPFWELPPTLWDEINDVGLRNHYICSAKAAEIMTGRLSGLIVNISSIGGIYYMFTPAFGIGKCALDRMAADCAKELRKHNVTFVSLWPGPVQTEMIQEKVLDTAKDSPSGTDSVRDEIAQRMAAHGETTEFSGKCIVALAQDPNLFTRTGQILLTADLAEEFNLTDVDGRRHSSPRSIKGKLKMLGWNKTADYVPAFIKIPRSVMNLAYGSL